MENSDNLKIEKEPIDSELKRKFKSETESSDDIAKVPRAGSAKDVADSKLLKTKAKVETVLTGKKIPNGVSPDDFKLFNDMRSCRGPIKNLVMVKIGNETPLSQLNRMSCVWQRPFRLSHESNGGGNWHSKVFFDGVTWSETWGQKKACRQIACEAAVWKMNQYFYSVEMGRNSIGEVYFDRSEMKKKDHGCYISNTRIPPSNKDEPDPDIDPNETAKMYRIAELANPSLFQPFKHDEEIFRRLKALVDEYNNDEADTCELLFVRQYPLPIYQPVEEYATQLGLLTKRVGSSKDRMLVVYKSNSSSMKTNWQLIWNLAILGKKDVEGLKIHPPKSLPWLNNQKGVKVEFELK